MDYRPALANNLWHISSWFEAKRFWRATTRPAESQTRLLQSYLTTNQATEIGRRYGFSSIHSVEDYQARVPLTTYNDYAEAVERIGRGEANVLTAAPVEMLEPSSGSTAASKLIPYTATLKAEFQRGLAPWIVDLFGHEPQLKGGPAYWSITPLTDGRRTTPAGIPIGFEEDSAYLGGLGRLIESALAVPNVVKQVADIDCFRYVTLLFLLRQADLRLISIWNPTFLSLLLAPLSDWWDRLLADIDAGTITPPGNLGTARASEFRRRLKPDPQRARRLATVAPADYLSLWPRLRLISCWTDGPSAPYAQKLVQQFPGVTIQGKGLLATEAFVSFPVTGRPGGVLAITAHFFEFLLPDGTPKLVHQLETGQLYEVVVTTGGGLYRYQLQDRVEVVDFVGQTPCIRFIGKTDQVSDQFGEKLSEPFVANTLACLFRKHNLSPQFFLLAPDDSQGGIRYTLYVETTPGQLLAPDLHVDLEQSLCENFHYAYCRNLGQLAAAHVVLVKNGYAAYLRACQHRGQKLGNIKPRVLDKHPGWQRWFDQR